VNPAVRVCAALSAVLMTVSCGQKSPDQAVPSEVSVAGDIPDNQAFVPFTSNDGTFTVSVPEGWARTGDAGATVFTDKFNSVRIERVAAAVEPHPAEAKSITVPALKTAVPGFVEGTVTIVQRKPGPVLEITYGGLSPTDPVTKKAVRQSVERYEFWRNGVTAVVTLASPEGADNVDPWRTITDSLQWNR
jgi:hypothetical protein